jgi:hypothetical protein
MAALGTEMMVVPPSMTEPWTGSVVTTLIAPSVLPASTSENGKSPAANVLTVFGFMTTEPPLVVGAWFRGVTLTVSPLVRPHGRRECAAHEPHMTPCHQGQLGRGEAAAPYRPLVPTFRDLLSPHGTVPITLRRANFTGPADGNV